MTRQSTLSVFRLYTDLFGTTIANQTDDHFCSDVHADFLLLSHSCACTCQGTTSDIKYDCLKII